MINFCALVLRTYFICLLDFLCCPSYDPDQVFIFKFDRTLEGFTIPECRCVDFLKIYKLFVNKDVDEFIRYGKDYQNLLVDIWKRERTVWLKTERSTHVVNDVDYYDDDDDNNGGGGGGGGGIYDLIRNTKTDWTTMNVYIYCPGASSMDSPDKNHVVENIIEYVRETCCCRAEEPDDGENLSVEFGNVIISILYKVAYWSIRHARSNSIPVQMDFLKSKGPMYSSVFERNQFIFNVASQLSNLNFHYANLFIGALNMIYKFDGDLLRESSSGGGGGGGGGGDDDDDKDKDKDKDKDNNRWNVSKFYQVLSNVYSTALKNEKQIRYELNAKLSKKNPTTTPPTGLDVCYYTVIRMIPS